MAQRTYLQSYVRLIRLPVMFELPTLAISHLMMIRRWWRFHCDYIAYSAQLNWDLAELGNDQARINSAGYCLHYFRGHLHL